MLLEPGWRRRGSLKRKILASVAWSTIAFTANVVLRLGSTVILTRLLTPDVFGVFAVVMTVIYILNMLSDFGVRSLILTHERVVDDSFLRSCWSVQILRGILLGIVIALVGFGMSLLQDAEALPAGSSYAHQVLPLAIAAVAASVVLEGLKSPNRFLYERRMEFRRVTQVDVSLQLLSTIIIIFLAFLLQNVWALVIGQIIGSAAALAASFFLFRGPAMRLQWRREHVGIVLGRGKWIASHSAQTALIKVADRILLGLVMPASHFGFYFIARQIVDLIESFLERSHRQMGLQVFTTLHQSYGPGGFIDRYYRYRMAFDAIAMITCGMLVTLAPLLVHIIYPDEYQPIAGIVQIVALGLPFTGPGLLRSAFSAQRRFRAMAVLSSVRLITIWGGLAIAVFAFGSITGALFVIAFHRVPELALLLWMGWRERLVSPIREIRFLPLIVLGAGAGWLLEQLWMKVTG